eukprot:TRINITY_DN61709_c0_g1_i1.p1 TRINITY_DN61709_c0_g1~~TRINITY_DN61709_c0_g1_i1.p1  ORF type:complete len:358 (+),score=72.73 TRINITY_DN61709_c0_g1_i1:56-1129(+)
MMYSGTVKSFNFEKGWGFVNSPEYGPNDVFLMRGDNGPLAAKGDQVSFSVTDTEKGPQAKDIVIVARGEGSFKGSVKSFNGEKGFGFINCDITKEIYGKDVFFMKTDLPGGFVTVGATVVFGVNTTEKGPQASKLKTLDGSQGMDWGMQSFSQTMHNMQNMQRSRSMPPSWMPSALPISKGEPKGGASCQKGVTGIVKSFNAEKGWGFIESPQFEGQDVFLMNKDISNELTQVGDTVQFNVLMSPRGPQAQNVTKVFANSEEVFANSEEVFEGIVKSYNAGKGWGFVTSPSSDQQFGDVFLHRGDLGEQVVNVGDKVQFTVSINQHGKPQAANVSMLSAWGPSRTPSLQKAKRASPY